MKITTAVTATVLGFLFTMHASAQTTPDAALDTFYQAAAAADAGAVITLLAPDAVFLGVDGAARLEGQALRDAISADFASGKNGAYRSSGREIRQSSDGSVAWFDEALENDQLGRGRASGVLVRSGGSWKIAQYDLSLPLPTSTEVTPVAASGTSGTAATGAAPASQEPPESKEPECRQLRHKTLKKSKC